MLRKKLFSILCPFFILGLTLNVERITLPVSPLSAYAATSGVSIIDGEDWSLPSWVTSWSPYGGIYWQYPSGMSYVTNPNLDVFAANFNWKDIHIKDGTYDWSTIDNKLTQIAGAGKKGMLIWEHRRVENIPQWVIDKYPKATVYNDWLFAYWEPGPASELKKFAQALVSRYRNDNRVAYSYAYYEPWRPYEALKNAGKTSEINNLLVPLHLDLLRIFRDNLGAAKTIASDWWSTGNPMSAHDTYAINNSLGLRNGGGHELDREANNYPHLDIRWDKRTGYQKAYSQPTKFYGTEVEEIEDYDYQRLILLQNLHLRFTWFTFSKTTYVAGPNTNWGILRDYVRKVAGYPSEKSPDAYSVLYEMYDWANRPMKNFERFLYQREVITGGKTSPVELNKWERVLFRTNYVDREDGYTARSTDIATGNNYIYFGLDDTFRYGGSNNVAIKVYFKDVGTAEWRIEYEAVDGNKYKSTQSVTNTNSGKWKTATFTINDAKFANGQGFADGIDSNSDGDYSDLGEKDGLDFRIYNGGSQNIIVGLVRVLRLKDPSGDSKTNEPLPPQGLKVLN